VVRVGEGTVPECLCDGGTEVIANLGPRDKAHSLEMTKRDADLPLRMAIGGMNRTPRVFPYDDVEVCGWTVPKGVSLYPDASKSRAWERKTLTILHQTPISMSTYWMHNDPAIFPEPDVFEPTRWIDADPEQSKVMRAYCVPFAKGSRNCVGQK
jgi:hypothetical protein